MRSRMFACSPRPLQALIWLVAFCLPAAAAAESRYVVVFRAPSVESAQAVRLVAARGGAVERDLSQIGVVVASSTVPGFAAALAGDPRIESVAEERLFALPAPASAVVLTQGVEAAAASRSAALDATVSDPTQARFFFVQWNMRQIRAPEAWAAGHLGDPAVTVALIDSGIDYTHTELLGKVDLARSVSLVPEDDALLAELFPGAHPIADLNFRGTFHAAMIACNAVVAACVAPNVTLVGVKVVDAAGQTTTGRVVAGITYAADIGADVISLGFSNVLSLQNAEDRKAITAIRRAIAYAKARGAAVIAEAGFGLPTGDADEDPLSVVAPVQLGAVGVSATDRDEQLAGATHYGRSITDLAAPGGNFTPDPFDGVISACSAFSQTFTNCARPTPTSPYHYAALVGFIATAPTAAGVAALIDSAHGGALPGHEVESILLRSAVDLGPAGKDPFFGHGRVDALNAVQEAVRD
jgi:subtilisin family serine protease